MLVGMLLDVDEGALRGDVVEMAEYPDDYPALLMLAEAVLDALGGSDAM